jgi:hypothetical protein
MVRPMVNIPQFKNKAGEILKPSFTFNVAGNLDKSVLPDIEKIVAKVMLNKINNAGFNF